MLRGMATVSFYADDVAAARDWYADLLGLDPYFVRPEDGPPAYVEFRIGDLQAELGIVDRRWAPQSVTDSPGGVTLYWHVDDLDATLARLTGMGATEHEPKTPRGEGFVTAAVVDPFGNVLGVMENPHYREMVEGVAKG